MSGKVKLSKMLTKENSSGNFLPGKDFTSSREVSIFCWHRHRLSSVQSLANSILNTSYQPSFSKAKGYFARTCRVIFWLFASLVAFYTVFFIIASFVHGIFKLDNFDGTIPFSYESYEDIFTNSTKWDTQPFLSDFIALECTYFLSTFVFLAFLRTKLWDFAVTVTIIHCAITCAVNVSFPLVWEWWICVLIGLIITISFGQLINLCLNLKNGASFKPNKSRPGAVS